MNYILFFFITIFLFSGCSKEPIVMHDILPKTQVIQSDYASLPNWERENYKEVLDSFINNCRAKNTQFIYKELCEQAKKIEKNKAKTFIVENFKPYKILNDTSDAESIMTGYFEPELQGSLSQTQRFKYPIYSTPKDLIVVDLDSIYSDLKEYRLRGRLDGNRIVPYYSRAQLNKVDLNAEVICYCDSKIDSFFLEVQGSGRVKLDNGKTIYIGYDNQNGHKYSSIGKYLVQKGEISQKNISLQSIRAWFEKNPNRVDEILNHNASLVFFKRRDKPASGSLGLELTPLRSIAVDRKYIPLGSMLYLSADDTYNRTVFAQDTGGAIKGAVRADIFLGFGNEAGRIAGELKTPLDLWIFVPKFKIKNII